MHGADVQDREGARLVFARLHDRAPRLVRIWADAGYRGQLIPWLLTWGRWVLEVVPRRAEQKGFHVLPKRWIVERTFAWLGTCRRLCKDHETLPQSSEAWIHLAMIALMLRRLDP